MATHVEGIIEVYDSYSQVWLFVAETISIFSDDYKIIALLFGERNPMNLSPIADNRGLPNRISHSGIEFFKNKELVNPTYVFLDEILEASEDKKSKIRISFDYDISQDEELWTEYLQDLNPNDGNVIWETPDQMLWKKDEQYFLSKYLSPYDIFNKNKEFTVLLKIMKSLNELETVSRVRWIVNFVY